MAHSVKYSKDYSWIAPVSIRHFETNLVIMRWFFQHATCDAGWIKFDFLSKSDGELTALRTAVPDIGTPKRDLFSFRTVLYHLSTSHRFSAEEITQINTLITTWSALAMDVLRSYSPNAPQDATGYFLLTQWANLAESVLQYLMRKTAHACSIIDTYQVFRGNVDLLQPLMNKMIIGKSTKLACQQAGELAIDSQDICKVAIQSYFENLPAWDHDPTLQVFLCTLVPGTLVDNQQTIAQLKTAKTGKTLHKRIVPCFCDRMAGVWSNH